MSELTEMLSLQQYAGKHLLVTGSTGYLANNLIHMLKTIPCKITRVARTGKVLTLVEGRCQVKDVISDLSALSLWKQILPTVDVVFHFAGQANIQQANLAPIEDMQHSILPLLRILEAARELALQPQILLASSVSLYGPHNRHTITEASPNQPQTIYDLHKLHCEDYLNYFSTHHGIAGTSLRLSNVYGPGIQAGRFYNGLINHSLYLGLQRAPLICHGKGEEARDYLYIDDASRAFLAAGLARAQVAGRTFIVSNGQSYTTQEVLKTVRETLQQQRQIETTQIDIPPLRATPMHFQAQATAFQLATGWQPKVTLAEGIQWTLAAQ